MVTNLNTKTSNQAATPDFPFLVYIYLDEQT